MTSQLHLWADVPTGARAPLPPDLSPVVIARSPDVDRWKLSPDANAAQATAFSAWWETQMTTLYLGEMATATVVAAWLTRSGTPVSFERTSTWDQAAISALWWRCDTELDDVPDLQDFTTRLGQAATLARERGSRVTLRPSATSYPTGGPAA